MNLMRAFAASALIFLSIVVETGVPIDSECLLELLCVSERFDLGFIALRPNSVKIKCFAALTLSANVRVTEV